MNMSEAKDKATRLDAMKNQALSDRMTSAPGTNWPLCRIGSYGLFFSVFVVCLTFITMLRMILNFITLHGGI